MLKKWIVYNNFGKLFSTKQKFVDETGFTQNFIFGFDYDEKVYKMLQLLFSRNGLTFWLENPTSKQSSCSCSVTYLIISETAWVTGILWIAASRRSCSVTALKIILLTYHYYYYLLIKHKFVFKHKFYFQKISGKNLHVFNITFFFNLPLLL